jgi:hypothetical protein
MEEGWHVIRSGTEGEQALQGNSPSSRLGAGWKLKGCWVWCSKGWSRRDTKAKVMGAIVLN